MSTSPTKNIVEKQLIYLKQNCAETACNSEISVLPYILCLGGGILSYTCQCAEQISFLRMKKHINIYININIYIHSVFYVKQSYLL